MNACLPQLLPSLKAHVQVFDRHGRLKSETEGDLSLHLDGNGFTLVGLNDILQQFWKGSGYTAAHYMLLVDNSGWTAFAAADTMSSHTGWTEATGYSESTRVVLVWGSVSGQAVATGNTDFTMTGSVTIKGIGVTTVSTKGGTTGTLEATVALASPQAVVNTDTLRVVLTGTAAAA